MTNEEELEGFENEIEVEKIRILHLLHQTGKREIWSEDLLSPHLFRFEMNYVLTSRERLIMEEMVRITGLGIDNRSAKTMLAKLLKIQRSSLVTVCSDIKRKLRNGIDSQVEQCIDLKHPRKIPYRWFKNTEIKRFEED